jgi:hypothetical protein
MKLKSLLCLALTILTTSAMANSAANPAANASSKKIAVLAAISDDIAVVSYRPQVGSNINPNVYRNWPLPLGPFNNAALLAADEAVKRAEPNSSTILLDVPNLAKQEHLLDKRQFNPPEAVRSTLTSQGATHVLLISKFRSSFHFPNPPGYVGHGTLEGLGFYLDNDYPIISRQTGKNSSGFIAPHAFFKVSLIDLASSTVIKEQAITANETYFSDTQFKPWDMISDQQKLESLIDMIKDETGRAVPALLQ